MGRIKMTKNPHSTTPKLYRSFVLLARVHGSAKNALHSIDWMENIRAVVSAALNPTISEAPSTQPARRVDSPTALVSNRRSGHINDTSKELPSSITRRSYFAEIEL